jgi:hypothetical protein
VDVALVKEGEDAELLKEGKFEERKEEWRQKVKANQVRDAGGGQGARRTRTRKKKDNGQWDAR